MTDLTIPTTIKYSGLEEKILNLLGSNIEAEQVAAAVGVTPSYISQLLSDEQFALAVSDLRYKSLQKHNVRDDKLDELEDKIIDKMAAVLPMVMRPMELTRMLQVVNGSKRRGASAPDTILQKQKIVTISLPPVIVQKFVTNVNNQVVQTGTQELITMQSGTLLERLKNVQNALPATTVSTETVSES